MTATINPLPDLRKPRFANLAVQQEFMGRLSALRKCAADMGDDEGKFEQAFANIAMTQIKNKSPQLLENLLGFQLVERNEDKTKAVGILGFDFGGKLMYVPLFFLSGEVKGQELLFLKDQNQFVPCEEDWVNYLLNRRPHVLGEGSEKTPRELGASTPQYHMLSWQPSGHKFASAFDQMPTWAQEFMPTLSRCTITDDRMFGKFANAKDLVMSLWPETDFEGFLSQSFEAIKIAHGEMSRRPAVKAAFDKMCGPDLLERALLKLRSKLAYETRTSVLDPESMATDVLGLPVREQRPQALEIRYKSAAASTLDLTDEQQENLLRDGLVVLDRRKEAAEVSTIYYSPMSDIRLQNPTETGIFEVLVKEGKFTRCLVVISPNSGDGRRPAAVVVPLEGDRRWVVTHPTNVFTKAQESKEEFKTWLESQSKAESLESGNTYLLLNESGGGTVPFEVHNSDGDGAYSVYFRDSVEPSRVNPERSPQYATGCWPSSGGPRIYLREGAGQRFRVLDGSLHTSTAVYKLKLNKDKKPKEDKDEPANCCSPTYSSEPDSPIAPGNIDDLQLQIVRKTAALKVWADHGTFYINNEVPATPVQAMVSLVCRHGLTEKVARHVLKESQKVGGGRYRIKYASPFLRDGMGPQAPAFPEPPMGHDPMNGAGMQFPMEQDIPVSGMEFARPGDYGMDRYGSSPDPYAIRVATQAAQTGQKKVFDTSAMSSLIRAVGDDSLVNSHLGDMMRAMNRLGQILFMFYWHQDDFADRYGKQDLPELEDALRNSFQALGDVILYLRQKSVRPTADELGEPQISDTARN